MDAADDDSLVSDSPASARLTEQALAILQQWATAHLDACAVEYGTVQRGLATQASTSAQLLECGRELRMHADALFRQLLDSGGLGRLRPMPALPTRA